MPARERARLRIRVHAGRRGPALAVALVLLLALGFAPGPAAAAPVAQPPGGYRLVEDWRERPWSLTPGRYGHAADIAATADGWRYVLDRRQAALHVLTGRDEARAVLSLAPWLPGEPWQARRVDGLGQRLAILLAEEEATRVILLRFDQGRLRAVEPLLDLPLRYNDLAWLPDGRLLLSRSVPRLPVTPPPRDRGPGPKGGVDLFSGTGQLLGSLDDRPLYYPIGVDAGPDGRVYVVNRVPFPDSDGPPGPVPTPEPAGGRPGVLPRAPLPPGAGRDLLVADRASARAGLQQREPEPQPGIVQYDAALAWHSTWAFNAPEDVAAGAAGVFVARQMEVFALGAEAPLWSGPTGQVIWPYSGGAPLHLELPPGRDALVASLAHCYTQGVLSFPEARPGLAPRRSGALDLPPLSGPAFPLRLDAEAAPVLLQGRFDREPAAGGAERIVLGERPSEPQSVLRWGAGGELEGQLGLCGGLAVPWQVDLSTPWWTRDLALDAGRVYTIDAAALRARPDEGFPAWTAWPDLSDPAAPSPDQVALDAQAGRLALLDLGRFELRLHDAADGRPLGGWPLPAELGGQVLLPVDLALGETALHLADGASRRILAFDLDGAPLGGWALPDSPAALTRGPEGSLFVLGRGSWVWRYAPDGRLEAYWRLPGPWAVDIAAGAEGRVYVAYARRERDGDPRQRSREQVLEAGVWVFEPEPGLALPEVDPEGCRLLPDKRARPSSLLLGGQVEVRLEVQGDCPGRYAPTELLLLVDRSRSMSWDSALDRAREGLRELLARLPAGATRLSLVAFADEPALLEPPGSAPEAILRSLAGLSASGDTRLASGLDLARQTLASAEPGRRRQVLLLTDGQYSGAVSPAIEALREAGIALEVLLYPVSSFDPSMALNLERMIGAGSVRVAPGPPELAAIADALAGRADRSLLFESLRVRDRVPANMRYVPGSAEPPARWDPARRELSWQLPAVPSERGVALRYRLEPLETGRWPTNERAWTEHRDGLGREGSLDFPVPRVRVLGRADLAWRLYLPAAARRDCARSQRPVDLVLAIDASQSMAEPAAAGGRKLDVAAAAAAALLAQLTPGRDRAALIAFDAEARRLAELGPELAGTVEALGRLSPRPGTRIDLGLDAAAAALAMAPRSGAARALVLLSDGRQPGGERQALAAAERLAAMEVRRFTIALGTDADRALLEALASAPSDFYASPAAEDLAAIYRELAGRLACGDG